MQPSQYCILEKKLSEINKWFNSDDMGNFEPIPIKMLDNDIVITDGHTRAVVALKAGLKKVPVVWDEDDLNWEMCKECVEECKRQDITSPNDLLNRIIPEEECDTKWNKWCDAMQEKISNK